MTVRELIERLEKFSEEEKELTVSIANGHLPIANITGVWKTSCDNGALVEIAHEAM